MKKDKDMKSKRQAFMSFLQAPTSNIEGISPQKNQKKANSDNQQFQQVYLDTEQCIVCQKQMNPDKKKKCGFCGSSACSDHLRKRRKLKNKWQKICDDCQDKYLYQTYMKLQIKAQQALQIQYQIVNLKYDEKNQELQAQQQRRRNITFKAQILTNDYQKKMKQLQSIQNKLMSKSHAVQSLELQVRQLQQYVKRMEKMHNQNYEQDYKLLNIQNEKIRNELNLYGKRCQQIMKTIQRKQSQLQNAYQKWQEDQYRKSIIQQPKIAPKKKEKDCQIY